MSDETLCEECGGYRENAVCHHVGRFTICGNIDPLVAGGQCTQPVGHQGLHRNRTGFFWGCDERLKGD